MKILKWFFRILSLVILAILIFKIVLLYHFSSYKEFYISQLNRFLRNEIHQGLEIGDVNYEILGLNIGTEFTLKNISLKDSLYYQHKIKTLEIPKAILRLKLLDILDKKITIKEITIENAHFNLFHLPNSYSNEYLFSIKKHARKHPEKNLKKSKLVAFLDILTIKNSLISIDQRDIGKKFEFYINQVLLYPNTISKNMEIKMELDILFKNLQFKTANGSFLKNAHVLSKPIVHFTDSFISFSKTPFSINNTPYNVAAIFGVQQNCDTLDLRIQSDHINYSNTIKLLSPNLELLLKEMNFGDFIKAKASIVGHFSDDQPKIKVDFDLDKIKANLPYLKLNTLSMKGYFLNYYDSTKKISDDNSAIFITDLLGKNQYQGLSASSISIINMINPKIIADIELKGDVRGLNEFVPNHKFEMKAGTYQIKGLYNNDFNLNLQKLLDIKGDFQFKNVKAYVPQYKYWVENFNCNVKYKDKKLEAEYLNFRVTSNKDPIHNLLFSSQKSTFDFKDKIKIYTQFKAVSHPEIFKQFTTKYHIEPKNGQVEFTGIFDDILYFDIDNIPNLKGTLNIKDVDVYLDHYPIKLLKTNGIIDIKGSKATVQNLSTVVLNKKDTHLDQSFRFSTENALVELSSHPWIHSKFKISSKMNPFNGFLKEKSIELSKGTIDINGIFEGKIEGTYQNLDKIDAEISLKDVSLNLKKINVLLENISSDISLKHWDINMPKFEATYRMYKVFITLQSKDILQYWLGLSKTNHSNISIYSPSVSINTLEDIQKKIPTTTSNLPIKPDILNEYSSYDFLSGSLKLKFGMLNYNKYLLKNFDVDIEKTANNTTLNHCTFNVGEGKGFISGTLKIQDNINTIHSNIKFDEISISYLKNKFPEYLPTEMHPIDMSGHVTIASNANFQLDMKSSLIKNSFNAQTDISFQNLKINHIDQVVSLKPKWLFKKWIKNIETFPFKLHVITLRDSTYINKTQIKSNVSDVWLDGTANLKGNYQLNFYIPYYNLSNFIFNKNISKDSFKDIKKSFIYKLIR